jgi:hypothetical protein
MHVCFQGELTLPFSLTGVFILAEIQITIFCFGSEIKKMFILIASFLY